MPSAPDIEPRGRDRVAARVMPVLGGVAILAIAACVVLMRNQAGAFALSLAGLLLFLADMAATLGGNVPINKQVQSWNTAAPPSDWPHCATDGSGCTPFVLH